MLLGILSDSHGRADTTRLAVTLLHDRGAELLLHLGDIGGEQVIDELVGHPAHIVFGNCDWNDRELGRYAEIVGIINDHPIGRIVIDGRTVAFTHGHLLEPMQQAVQDGVDYLLHGHTHELRDERVGRTRVINPGALFRAARYTAALLDPRADRMEILALPRC